MEGEVTIDLSNIVFSEEEDSSSGIGVDLITSNNRPEIIDVLLEKLIEYLETDDYVIGEELEEGKK